MSDPYARLRVTKKGTEMRNFRMYHGETPVSALMSRGVAYRTVNYYMSCVPAGDSVTVRDREGRVIFTRIGTGTNYSPKGV